MKYNSGDPIDEAGEPSTQTEPGDHDLTAVNLPPFNIISSCRTLGFHKPMDCFWSEVTVKSVYWSKDRLPCSCADYRRIGSRWSGLRASAAIEVYMHRCLFNEHDASTIYRMGQCPACNTIYWTPESKASDKASAQDPARSDAPASPNVDAMG